MGYKKKISKSKDNAGGHEVKKVRTDPRFESVHLDTRFAKQLKSKEELCIVSCFYEPFVYNEIFDSPMVLIDIRELSDVETETDSDDKDEDGIEEEINDKSSADMEEEDENGCYGAKKEDTFEPSSKDDNRDGDDNYNQVKEQPAANLVAKEELHSRN